MDALKVQRLTNVVRGVPLVWLFRRSSVADVLLRDAQRANYTQRGHTSDLDTVSAQDVRALVSAPAFRTVVYRRLLHEGTTFEGIAALLLGVLWRGQDGVEIACPSIGPGLVLSHAMGLVVRASWIGRDCFFAQGVTVGVSNKGGPPTIGNGVILWSGATVIGPITIGDGAVVGANAVVLHDVPPQTVVVGSPARVVGSAPADPWAKD